MDLLAPHDFRVAEQVVEVPKIVCPPRAARTVLRAPQTAEQLVDVPTVVSYSSLQQLIVEQTVDMPVLGRAGGGVRGGLHPGQGPTASSGADRVDILVPGSGRLQGSRPGQGSTASSSRSGIADEAGQGVFRTFPRVKKSAGLGPHSGSELSADFPRCLSSSCLRFRRGLPEVCFMRSSTGGMRWRRQLGGVCRMPFWKRRRWMRTRKRKRWRARGSFLTSVLVAGAGACLLAASAHMDGSAPLHTTSLSSIQTRGSAICGGGWLVSCKTNC